jgi:hypothetical protein
LASVGRSYTSQSKSHKFSNADYLGKECAEAKNCIQAIHSNVVPCFEDSVPFDHVTLKERAKILQYYQLFNVDNPKFCTNDLKAHEAQILKATKEFFCAFNPSPQHVKLADEICTRSIMEPGFNEKYSKLYKYARQCFISTYWVSPDEFPVELHSIKMSSWSDLRTFLNKNDHKAATPEVLLPPVLLYPWVSPAPEDIEQLEEDSLKCKLDRTRIRDILSDIIKPPTKQVTMTDFVWRKQIAPRSTPLALKLILRLKELSHCNINTKQLLIG